jgi:cyanophycin synthetase
MSWRHLRSLPGPNVWATFPVLEGALDLGDGTAWSAEQIRHAIDSLRAEVLGTRQGPTDNGDVSLIGLTRTFGLTVLKLQDFAGYPVSFSAFRPTSRPGQVLAALEFAVEPVGRAAAEIAWRLLGAAREGRPLLLAEEVGRLLELTSQHFPGGPLRRTGRASPWVIYQAARARGIPAAQLSPDYWGCLRLGQGSKQHRCRASEPDTVGAVAYMASTDKNLAKQLLQAAGVPVPQGLLAATAEDAWGVACTLGLPVAIKPQDSDIGKGVSLDLRTHEQVEAAFRAVRRYSDDVLVERFAPGVEHRVLVVGDRVVAVARIEPPHVAGDGVSSVAELVDRINRDPRRGDWGTRGPLYKLRLDEVAREVLAAQGHTPASVPPDGVGVLLRRTPPYLPNGGNLIDVTDRIHPSNAAHAVAAAQALQIPVAGLDVVAVDISKPLEEQGGVVVEVNVSPALWLHLAPWNDPPHPVGEEIVALLFPPGQDGRIPVAALVGADPAPAAGHLTALLTLAGSRVGRAGAAEIVIGRRRWPPPAQTPQDRAGLVLMNPTVDVALLETNPRELVRAGFGNDRCDVALVLDGAAPSDGELGPEIGDFAQALGHALSPEGVLVLPAGDEPGGGETPVPPARVLLVAPRGDLARVQAHRAAGGRALVAEREALLLAEGAAAPVALGPCPRSLAEGESLGLLAALAAGLALGVPVATARAYLARPDFLAKSSTTSA